MSSSRRACAVVVALLVWAGSCSRPSRPRFERLAMLPFENLAPGSGLEWASRGLPGMLQAQLGRSARLHAFPVPGWQDTISADATQILEGYFSQAGGRFEAHAVLEDSRTRRTIKRLRCESSGEDRVLTAGRCLAAALEDRPARLGTANQNAFQALSEGSGERAAALDPGFGDAYLLWAEQLLARRDPAIDRVLAAAQARQNQFQEPARTRLALLAARLRGDVAGEAAALRALTALMPADPGVFSSSAALEMRQHRYASAAGLFRASLERQPENPNVLNELGYAQCYSGDLAGAVASLREYARLRPQDANPQDSLGDVYFYHGRFQEAAQAYLDAQRKSPAPGETLKAAYARLRQGDRGGARELFENYARLNPGNPLIEYRRAEWEDYTGQRAAAVQRLRALSSGGPPVVQVLSNAQLTVWYLEEGRRAEAAAAAGRIPPGPLALMCRFVSQPSAAPAVWQARAGQAFAAQRGLENYGLGLALLLDRHFGEAAKALESAPGSPEIFLAWSRIESGTQLQETARLVSGNPAIRPQTEDPFESLAFPRILYLRGLAAEKLGHRQGAAENYRAYLEWAGSPTVFGEREHCQAYLGKN